MRLTQNAKDVVLAARPGSTLVRVGDRWGVVWHVSSAPVRLRWHAQLVHDVERAIDPDSARPELRVWWEGAELVGATRRAVVDLLHQEVAR